MYKPSAFRSKFAENQRTRAKPVPREQYMFHTRRRFPPRPPLASSSPDIVPLKLIPRSSATPLQLLPGADITYFMGNPEDNRSACVAQGALQQFFQVCIMCASAWVCARAPDVRFVSPPLSVAFLPLPVSCGL